MEAEKPSAMTKLREMHVEFALFLGDELLHLGNLVVRPEKNVICYGSHRHVKIVRTIVGTDVVVPLDLFEGLIVSTEFDLPASSIEMEYYQLRETGDAHYPIKQIRLWKSALRMGVHTSEDWESLALDKHTLAFKCTAF